MSLELDGIWKAGVWAPTVWTAGVWSEGVSEPSSETGGARRRTRFIAKFKKELYEFANVEALESFISDALKTKQVSKKKLHKEVRIRIAPGIQSQLYKFDLPELQPIAQRFDFRALEAVLSKFDGLLLQAQMRADLEADDEEVLLLL